MKNTSLYRIHWSCHGRQLATTHKFVAGMSDDASRLLKFTSAKRRRRYVKDPERAVPLSSGCKLPEWHCPL